MKSFLLIQEDITIGDFSITESQFREYMSFIDSIIKGDLYSSRDNVISVDGIEMIKALPSEVKRGRTISILNKVNTNRNLMSNISFKFKIKTFIGLKEFIQVNKVDLFTDNGRYFNEIVWNTIRKTEEVGEKNEEMVCVYIKDIMKSKYNVDVDPIREITSSYKDMILGIDITFPYNGKEYTCQVKPLKSISDDGVNIKVRSSGRIKKYDTDYIAFSNYFEKSVFMFRNKGVTINGDVITIPIENMVKK